MVSSCSIRDSVIDEIAFLPAATLVATSISSLMTLFVRLHEVRIVKNPLSFNSPSNFLRLSIAN